VHDTHRTRPWILIVCYLPLLGIFPLLLARKSREVRWHARNGLLLFGGVVAVAVAATVVSLLIQRLACLYSVAMFFVGVIYVIVVILAIVKALQGERLIFPGLSRYADRG
jgi:uncharacterized membrane protein